MNLSEQVSFVRAADGTRIAYRSEGTGTPLVFTNGFSTSHVYWRPLWRRLRPQARLVSWDLKGHGTSRGANCLAAVGVEDSVDDLRRVLDAAGVDRAVLLGFSFGCQIVLEAWRRFPDRIAAIVPILGTWGRPFDHLLDPRIGPLLHRLLERVGPDVAGGALRLAGLAGRLPGTVRFNQLLGLIGPGVDRRAMRPFFDGLTEIHGPTWAAMGAAAGRHSAEDVLPTIDVPVLVVGGGRDALTPAHLARAMARAIPGAEHLVLADCGHTGLLEAPGQIADRLIDFLAAHGLWPDSTP